MDVSSDVLGTLPKGAGVTVYFAVQSVQGNWCEIAVKSEQRELGFIECPELHRGHAPPSGVSGATSQSCENLVDLLMDASGITSVSLGDPANYASAPGLERLSSSQRADVIAIIRKQFNISVVEADIHQGMLNQCDPVNYAAVLDTLHSPLAVRMIRLEISATTPSATRQNKIYVARMEEHPASQERIAMLERLDRASGTSDFVIDMAMSVASSTASAITGRSFSQSQLDAALERIAPQVRQALLMGWVALYRSVSDDDLQQYARLWESEPLRQFSEMSKAVALEAAEMRASAAGAELRGYVDAERARRAVH
jgi:hypothetical protein